MKVRILPYYKETLEDFISDMDDVYERYTLCVRFDDGVNAYNYIYKPDDIDHVEPNFLEHRGLYSKAIRNKKDVIIEVYLV